MSHSKVNYFYAPIFTISIVIFVLYIFSIFDALPYGLIAVYILSLVSLFYFILKNLKLKFSAKKLLGAILYLVPLTACILALDKDFRLFRWDEFGNWALNVKYMLYSNQLYTFSNLEYFTFKHYPPAQQLYHYFFLRPFDWSEKGVMIAQFTLIFSTLIAIFSTQGKNIIYGGLALIASSTIIYHFHYAYNTIYADTFLAFYFAAIFLYILKTKYSIQDTLLISILIFNLGLIKQTGLILQIILYLVISIKFLRMSASLNSPLSFTLNFAAYIRGEWMSKRCNPFLSLLIPAFAILSSYFSWKLFLNSLLIPTNPRIPSLIKFLEPPLSEKGLAATHLFLLKLNEAAFNTDIKLYKLMMLYTLAGLICSAILNKRNKIFHSLALLTISFGCVIYFLFLLFSYITFFGAFEGPLLYGIERYTATYFISWSLILLGYFVNFCLFNSFNKILLISTSIFLLAIKPPVDFYQIMKHFPTDEPVIKMREDIDNIALNLRDIPADKKVYFISQNTSGYEARVFQYTISPRQASNDCWSVGSKYSPLDLYTCNKRFEDLLSGYDYLAIYKSDEKFWNEHAHLFSNSALRARANGIYKVNHLNGDLLMIEPLQK